MFHDYSQCNKLLNDCDFDICLINDLIALFDAEASLAVTMHPRKLNGWLNQRAFKKFPPIGDCWINRFFPTLDVNVTPCYWGGSSGLFAAKVAVEDLHYEKVILCGCPMDSDANHFLRKKPWATCNGYRSAWEAVHKMGKLKNVRSMSGWTKDLLGFPDLQWISE